MLKKTSAAADLQTSKLQSIFQQFHLSSFKDFFNGKHKISHIFRIKENFWKISLKHRDRQTWSFGG